MQRSPNDPAAPTATPTVTPTVTVAVVSPLAAVVRGLTTMLADHDRVRVLDLPTAIRPVAPDVVLYDAQALAHGDTAGLDRLVSARSSVVLVMTHDLRPQLAQLALDRGADGVFGSGVGREQLLRTVTDAADRGLRGTSDAPVVPLRLGQEAGLTPREVDVLSMITAGLSNQEIAEACYLSINSVKTYIRGAYRRIDVTSRSQAVVWCVQHGFAGPVAA